MGSFLEASRRTPFGGGKSCDVEWRPEDLHIGSVPYGFRKRAPLSRVTSPDTGDSTQRPIA
eukprot:81294-Prymnesium_polylepis.1